MSNISIYDIFPTPIGMSALSRDLTSEEREFILLTCQSLKRNVHNKSSVDNYVLDNPILKNLKIELLRKVQTYVTEVFNPATSVDVRITQSWLNVSEPGGGHHPHAHPNSFISGTFYIQALEEEDCISFAQFNFTPIMRQNLRLKSLVENKYVSDYSNFNVKTNDIILFPSSLWHSVPPMSKERNISRISLAFNTYLVGDIGDDHGLTRLIL